MLDNLMAIMAAGGTPAALPSPEDLSEELERLSAPQKALLAKMIMPQFRVRARDEIASYIDYMEMGFRPAPHHSLLIRELEAVERGDNDRLMVCMPPGSAKSTYTSVVLPPWYMGRNPKKNVIATSHTQDLVEAFGRRGRNFFASPMHRAVFGVGLAVDRGGAAAWATEKGGEYYAAGVGGAITGHRADLGLIDDPVKSREDADSDRSREKVWEWYVNDFKTRLKPGAAQIVVMTRWHEDDLGGRILEMEGARWKVLKLPMEAGINDPLGRAPKERLWPEWFTAEMVADAKRDVRVWNALYQQEPTGEDGDYFKRDWFPNADTIPTKLAIYGASDYAVTEGAGDFTEHGIFGIDPWSNIYILDWWRGQAASDVWIEAKCDLIKKHQPLCWFGEAGPIRRAVEPFLMRRMQERNAFCRLEWLPSIHDKPTRCRAFQALASSGKVFVPRRADWKADVLGQLFRFPAGLHDDAVDVCSLIGRGLSLIHAPEVAAEMHGMQTRASVAYSSAKRYGRRR